MDVGHAIATRRSVRGFLDRPVPRETLESLAIRAARAATGGNLQPWHVDIVMGDTIAGLKATMAGKLARGDIETAAYAVYPPKLAAPYSDRRAAIGEALYGHLGIPREDRDGRRAWFARNFRFFGAPAAYFVTVDRGMGPPQWADLGMYLQNLMLLAVEAGLATCPQECWAMYPDTVGAVIETPAERMLFCGVAIGYENVAEPANRTRSARADKAEWLTIRGA
ncbi:nitroreductase [Sphingomonas bacterium]|uniref:nitroreductase n=1 Tax=Sphingomonas bacterium TaxID=1895847 RepID=UPI001576606E|nr:nitroreductase [Sphingomonas bacterium]